MSIGSFPRLGILWLSPQLPQEMMVVSPSGCNLTVTIPQFGQVKTFGSVFFTTWITRLLRLPIFLTVEFVGAEPIISLLKQECRICLLREEILEGNAPFLPV
jgi:hypothetical protein